MEELWRDVVGWEDRYMGSNTGKVYSKLNNIIKKTSYSKDGYEVIMLSRDGKQFGTFVHRLVAMAFIPNPMNYPIINHKDENPANNFVDNLEWCTFSYNNTYKNKHLVKSNAQKKRVYQYDRGGFLVAIHDSVNDACRFLRNRKSGNISSCCNNKVKTAYGFVFSFTELSSDEVRSRFEES